MTGTGLIEEAPEITPQVLHLRDLLKWVRQGRVRVLIFNEILPGIAVGCSIFSTRSESNIPSAHYYFGSPLNRGRCQPVLAPSVCPIFKAESCSSWMDN